jgi:uncharacterized membrane protein
MSTFKLVVKGEVLSGHEADTVKARIARLLKLEPDSKQMAALFSGRALRLRGGLNREQAEKFQAVIRSAGLGCEIVAEATESEPKPEPAPQPAEQPMAAPEAGNEKVAMHPGPSEGADSYNPNQQPQAEPDVAGEPGEFDLVEPKKLGAGAGWDWFKEGYYYFKQSPMVWVGSILIFWLITMAVSMVPLVSILVNIFMPVFTAGFMMAAYKQFKGEVFAFADMFAGFRNNTGNLLGVGALYLLGTIIVMVATFGVMIIMMGGFGGLENLTNMEQGSAPPAPLPVLLAVLVMLVLLLPLMMAYWFAPALVILNGVSPVQAMRLSLKGCLRNWLPFLVYGIVGMVLGIVAVLPLFLGLLVLAPIGMASIFASYRQIYTDTSFNPPA